MPQVIANSSGWQRQLLFELAPTHGRLAGALRTAAAAALAAAVLLHLQLPMIAPGIYLIFLISYDLPYLTFKHSLQELATQACGVLLALSLIVVTDNDPMARVLGIAAFTFLSAFLLHACTLRVVAMNLGIFPVLTLSLWELHQPPSQLVYLSFAPIATGAVAVGCKLALEYLFTRRDPYYALQWEMKNRLAAVENLFAELARGSSQQACTRALQAVTRYAFSGQGRMSALLQELGSEPGRAPAPDDLPPIIVPSLARFLDLSASIGRRAIEQTPTAPQPCFQILSERLGRLIAGDADTPHLPRICAEGSDSQALLQIEEALDNLTALSRIYHPQSTQFALPPEPAEPWFRDDALTNPEYKIYAAKLSLSATLCYVLYNAMAWSGISTATLTVLVAGLSTSGASNQKMFFRLIGCLLGGVFLGLGCQILVYLNAATALPFLISVFAVSFLGAWIARGAHLGYVGLQIVFSFYLVAFQESMTPRVSRSEFSPAAFPIHAFTSPLSLTQGRDRIAGILLALAVMWIVFHRLHPQRAVERMRNGLANLLRIEAQQIGTILKGDSSRNSLLRRKANAIVLEIRTLSEAIPYELDQHVVRDRAMAETIEEALTQAGSIFLHANAAVHSDIPFESCQDFLQMFPEELIRLADALDRLNPEDPVWKESRTGKMCQPVSEDLLHSAGTSLNALRQCCAAILTSEASIDMQ